MRKAFTLQMAPKPKGRPRAAVIKGKPRIYTPRDTEVWEQEAAMRIRSAFRQVPLPIVGPVAMTIDMVFHRIKSPPKGVTRDEWKAGARVRKATKPDIDNCIKTLLDAMTMARIWHDDGQVWSLTARTWYAADGEVPSVTVSMMWDD